MYHLAVLALLGLALFKLVDVLEDLVPGLTRFHGLVTLVLAVAGAAVQRPRQTGGRFSLNARAPSLASSDPRTGS